MALVNFFGAASGLDTGSLIDSLLNQQRQSRIAPLKQKLSSLSETKSSLTELKDKISNFKNIAGGFREIAGGALAKSATVSDEVVLSATATKGALNTSVAINVNQLATNASVSFNDTFSQVDSLINAAGNPTAVDITIGSGNNSQTFSIAIDSTTSVTDFVSKFNQSTDRAVASTVNVGTTNNPQYKIVMTSLSEGTTQGALTVSDPSGIFSGQTVDQASDAILSVSGISGFITRESNSISDLIPGVKLDLKSIGQTNITVSTDSENTSTDLKGMVDALNDIIQYVNKNDLVTTEIGNGENRAIFGSLSLTSLDETLLSSLKSGLNSASISEGLVRSLADLGVTTARDGSLKFDEQTFSSALTKDSKSTSKILSNLGESLASTGGIIDQFTRFGGLFDGAKTASALEVNNINKKISDLEKNLSQQEERLIAQFSRLESEISRMQSQGTHLQSILSGITK